MSTSGRHSSGLFLLMGMGLGCLHFDAEVLTGSIYGCITIDVKADVLFREKRLLINQATGDTAVAEIKIWSVPRSKDYPQGRKFSLFLVSKGEVIVGYDNHKPKGPHLHLGNAELAYLYRSEEQLLIDFWDLARKAGFEP